MKKYAQLMLAIPVVLVCMGCPLAPVPPVVKVFTISGPITEVSGINTGQGQYIPSNPALGQTFEAVVKVDFADEVPFEEFISSKQNSPIYQAYRAELISTNLDSLIQPGSSPDVPTGAIAFQSDLTPTIEIAAGAIAAGSGFRNVYIYSQYLKLNLLVPGSPVWAEFDGYIQYSDPDSNDMISIRVDNATVANIEVQ